MNSFFILFEIVLVAFVIYKQGQYFNETRRHIDAFTNIIPESKHFGLVHYDLSAEVLKNIPPLVILNDLDRVNSLADPDDNSDPPSQRCDRQLPASAVRPHHYGSSDLDHPLELKFLSVLRRQ